MDWICPWDLCNHDQAQQCRNAATGDSCRRRFPADMTPEQARQEATKPSVPEAVQAAYRAWRLNRWPAGLPRGVDWSDVETAFRAGFFQGQSTGFAGVVNTTIAAGALGTAGAKFEFHSVGGAPAVGVQASHGEQK